MLEWLLKWFRSEDTTGSGLLAPLNKDYSRQEEADRFERERALWREEQALRWEARRQEAAARKRHEEAARKREEEARKRQEQRAAARKRQEELAAAERERHLELAAEALSIDYLTAGRHARDDQDPVDLPDEIWQQARVKFVQDWSSGELKVDLDDEQAATVGSLDRDVKVVARAGSGKTRVLTARALFLLQVCGLQPDEILLLAFNRNAADEMRSRIRDHAPKAPPVMTFHALAHALVKPTEDLLYDDPSEGVLKRSRAMQAALQLVIDKDEESGWPLVRRVMSPYFRADLEQIEARGLLLGEEQGLEYRRGLAQESLRGDFVKSFGEKRIANVLFENDVDYRYEAAHDWGDGSPYRPDFTIWKSKVVIEYFGMTGNPEYDDQTEKKKDYWEKQKQKGWTLIALDQKDVAARDDEAFETHLVSLLEKARVKTSKLSNAEVWEKCRARSIERITDAIAGVLSRVRAQGMSVGELRERAGALRDDSSEEFARAAAEVLEQYEQICKRDELDDFSGLIWRGVEESRNGKTTFSRDQGRETGDLRRLRVVLVDEIQDFTPGFHALVSAIRIHAPRVAILGVGDDWQSINRFAGTDPRLFTDFPGPVGGGARLHLRTNYRSAMEIVSAGNGLMLGRGEPAVAHSSAPGRVALVCADQLPLTPVERHTFEDDILSPTLLRLLQDRLGRGQSVTLLARNKTLPRSLRGLPIDAYHADLRKLLPKDQRDRLSVSTVHRFKGKEDDVVVILDAVRGRYPFIHPQWVFYRVLGDTGETVTDDERRLFYVALTRGRHETLLMGQTGYASQFLEDMDVESVSGRELAALPVPTALTGKHEALVVHGGYEIRDQLGPLGFDLDRKSKAWWMVGPPDKLTEVQQTLEKDAPGHEALRQPAETPLPLPYNDAGAEADDQLEVPF